MLYVGEVAESWELSYTDGRNVKCYNHFGKQFASFLKT